MNVTTLSELATRVADAADAFGGTLVHVEMTEMGDGSRRSCALATTIDGEHEQVFRVASPAPWNSPAWASVYREWTTELRVGDGWMTLNDDDEEGN